MFDTEEMAILDALEKDTLVCKKRRHSDTKNVCIRTPITEFIRTLFEKKRDFLLISRKGIF